MERQSWRELLPVDRYRVCASGLLHEHDRHMLTMLYQPLVGSKAIGLYNTLWSELKQYVSGGEESNHHALMIHMYMPLPEIYEERMKLEALGLLKVYVKKEQDIRSFLYELQPPLSPKQFFDDVVLNIFLYNRLGKTKYNKLKQSFLELEYDASAYSEVTHSFNDVFQSFSPSQIASLQEEVSVPSGFAAPGRTAGKAPSIWNDFFDFELFAEGLSALVPKKVLTASVKEAIVKLAYVYGMNALAMQNVVLGALTEHHTIDMEKLRKGARDWYQFENGSAVPVFSERVQPLDARTMQHKEPSSQEELLIQQLEQISPRELLKEISGGTEPTAADLKIIEDVMLSQKLLPGVVNVLIYYVMLRTDMKLSKTYVEKIAGHWARKKVTTVQDAMMLAKEENRQYQEWATSKKTPKKRATTRKEQLPEWLEEQKQQSAASKSQTESAVDLEEERRRLEEELKMYKKE